MRTKYVARDGFKICYVCKIEFEATREFFYKNIRNRDELSYICIKCDLLKRSIRQKTKASHNIPRRCRECESFFYAARADINKNRKRFGKEGGIFCSLKCSRTSSHSSWNRKGSSWNGARSGVNNPNLKYSFETIKEAKLLFKKGIKCKDISHKLNIKKSYLYQIKRGSVWSSLKV